MEGTGVCTDAGDSENKSNPMYPDPVSSIDADGTVSLEQQSNHPQFEKKVDQSLESNCEQQFSCDAGAVTNKTSPDIQSHENKEIINAQGAEGSQQATAMSWNLKDPFLEMRQCEAPEASSESHDVDMMDHQYCKDIILNHKESRERGFDCETENNFFCEGQNMMEDLGDFKRESSFNHSVIEASQPIISFAAIWSPPYQGGLTLDELHDDVILHIARFLPARDIQHGLSQVCQRFRDIFDNEAHWKARVLMRCNKVYPAVEVDDFSWVDACVAREDSYALWADWEENTQHFMYGNNVNGEVDVVHLMKNGEVMVSGDRNRSLNVVDLKRWSGEKNKKDMLVHTDYTHGGWIWSLASVDDTLISGSWDTKIRVFDMAGGCKHLETYKCSSAVLSLYAEGHEVVASCFKEVVLIDRRSGELRHIAPHSKPVLCLAACGDYVITGSEDKSISVLDKRAGKVLNKVKLDEYPICMSCHDNQLWFGDRVGELHLHNGTHGKFDHVGTYNVGHTGKLTGLVTSAGATITSSGDKSIRVLEPTRDPAPMATINVHRKEVARIDYKNNVLVSAGGDECVGVWLPRNWGEQFI